MALPPWTASYPPGLRWDADIPVGPVDRLLDDAAARWPDRAAIDFMGRSITFAELAGLVARAARGLQDLGVGPGVHVGLYLPNTPHYMVSFLAVLKAGGVVVNYSPLDAERVLEHKVEDSRTDVLVTLDLQALYPQMARLLGRTRLRTLVVGTLGEMAAHPGPVTAHLRAGGQLAEVATDDRHVPFARLLDNDGRCVAHDIGDPREALAVLQYTGGTTGLPKGAMLTHANLTAANHQFVLTATLGGADLREGEERFLAVLPPFHIYALSVNMLLGLRLGATQTLHVRFDVADVLKDLSSKRITVFPGVPTMYTAINQHPDVERFDLRSLKYCGSGGAPLPVEVHERFLQLTGCSLAEGWGMTETSPSGTFTPMTTAPRPGSCGLPVPGLDVRLVRLDDPDACVAPGERGEMVVRGPNVTKGYWNAPDATREAFNREGFFRTGDVAWMDDDGYLHIVDRTKDMLLCSGFNVYPRVIEEAIYRHPSVAEACVIGIPDAYRGQSPKAFVALRVGAEPLTLAALQDFLKDQVGRHEMVAELEIRDTLPKTPVGKLSKKTLVDEEAARRAAA